MNSILSRIFKVVITTVISVFLILGVAFGCMYLASYFLFPNGSGASYFLQFDRKSNALILSIFFSMFSLIGGITIPLLIEIMSYYGRKHFVEVFGACGFANSWVVILWLFLMVGDLISKPSELPENLFVFAILIFTQIIIGGTVGLIILKINKILDSAFSNQTA
jgi:hypothetical protein